MALNQLKKDAVKSSSTSKKTLTVSATGMKVKTGVRSGGIYHSSY